MWSRRLRPYAWFALLAAPLMIAYSAMTIVMIGSLGGAPNYVGDPARDVLLPEVIFVVAIVMVIISIVVLVRTRERRA